MTDLIEASRALVMWVNARPRLLDTDPEFLDLLRNLWNATCEAEREAEADDDGALGPINW